MFKLLMWNSVDYLRRYYWIFVCMTVSIVLALIPAEGVLSAALVFFSVLLGALSFMAGIVFAAGFCFHWMESASSQLELSLPVATWKILLGKLALALLVNTLSCLFIIQLFVLLGKDASVELRFLSFDNIQTVLVMVLMLTVVDTTVLFSYLFSKSNAVTRNIWIVSSAVMSMIIFGVILVGSMIGMAASGAMLLPSISGKHLMTVDGTFQIIKISVPIIVSLLVVALEYMGSSALLALRFHVD